MLIMLKLVCWCADSNQLRFGHMTITNAGSDQIGFTHIIFIQSGLFMLKNEINQFN